jgi:ornithine cyclodeaminase/alanine dehydrogenase-like protein (mu-crystallin family)
VIQSGALARSAVTGAFADLVAGKLAARASADQTVLLVSVGIGALDIALGAELLKQARIQGVGQPLG